MKKFQGTGLFLSLGGLLFLIATLFYPCIPFSDPTGETVFLSRLDYALAILGHPEAVWALWLGGGDVPFFADRIPILVRAAMTFVGCWAIGRLLLKLDKLEPHLPRIAGFALSTFVGYFVINFAMFVLQSWLPIDHWMWPVSALAVCVVTLWSTNQLIKRDAVGNFPTRRVSERLSLAHASDWNCGESDVTLRASWKRRVFGLSSIVICVLFCVQILGALLPTVDQEVRRDVWWHIISKAREVSAASEVSEASEGQQDANALWQDDAKLRQSWLSTNGLPTIDYVSVLWSWESKNALMRNDQGAPFADVPNYVRTVLPSKVLITTVIWLGFVLIAMFVREEHGNLPAVIVLLLLGSTPCFMELERLGRLESLYGVVIAVLPVVYRYARRGGTVPVGCYAVLSYPMIVWLCHCWMTVPDPNYLRPEAIARFLGFSSLHAVGFMPLVAIGLMSRGSGYRSDINRGDMNHNSEYRNGGMEQWMAAVAVFIFLVVGLLCARLDRCWVPSLCLLTFSAARGVSILVREQSVWLGLPVWICILFFAMVGGIAWPTLDNRILASHGEILRSQWQYRESWSDVSEVSDRYTLELRNQMSEGKLGKSPWLLLIGDWDDLDVPMACAVWLHRDPGEISSAVVRYMEQGITHIALVSQVAPNAKLFSIDEEQKIRQQLEALKDKGNIQTLPVSASCRELALYAVNFGDAPAILSRPTIHP